MEEKELLDIRKILLVHIDEESTKPYKDFCITVEGQI
jgi:hypothetical protein